MKKEIIKHKGYKITLERDMYPENPREINENLGTMICLHKRYRLGDKHSFANYQELMAAVSGKEFIYLPLYLYDHSILRISTQSWRGRAHHAEWDSGLVGYIIVSKAKARKEFMVKRLTQDKIEKIYEVLRNEVEEYDHYLSGEVYIVSIYSPEDDKEPIETVCGHYGYDFAKQVGIEMVNYYANRIPYSIHGQEKANQE